MLNTRYSAIEQKFDVDIDYDTEIQHNGFAQLFASLGIMTPTVTYLGMVVAYDLGAKALAIPSQPNSCSSPTAFG